MLLPLLLTLQAAAPPEPPATWLPLIGEYARDSAVAVVLEDAGRLVLRMPGGESLDLTDHLPRPIYDGVVILRIGGRLITFDRTGRATRAVQIDGRPWIRRRYGVDGGTVFRITPQRPVEELWDVAIQSSPPVERGEFLPADLVDLDALSPTIAYDIRYATTNNFLGVPVYDAPRARLQRPAAEALVRAHRSLADEGYGLLVFDAYRPWYVTKIFWDATPDSLKVFVADPAQGSRHNRGAAVDLTLYDLRTGAPVVMPGGYDEMSPRSYPDFPGGTSRQRWLRQLLRDAMEAEGFTVYEAEWWHFDFRDWRRYRLGNVR